MGVARCAEIQAALLAGGKRADTPVAVVQSATGAAQAQLITTLGQLPAALAASGLGSPSIIVVGDVVRCAAALPAAMAAARRIAAYGPARAGSRYNRGFVLRNPSHDQPF